MPRLDERIAEKLCCNEAESGGGPETAMVKEEEEANDLATGEFCF